MRIGFNYLTVLGLHGNCREVAKDVNLLYQENQILMGLLRRKIMVDGDGSKPPKRQRMLPRPQPYYLVSLSLAEVGIPPTPHKEIFPECKSPHG